MASSKKPSSKKQVAQKRSSQKKSTSVAQKEIYLQGKVQIVFLLLLKRYVEKAPIRSGLFLLSGMEGPFAGNLLKNRKKHDRAG